MVFALARLALAHHGPLQRKLDGVRNGIPIVHTIPMVIAVREDLKALGVSAAAEKYGAETVQYSRHRDELTQGQGHSRGVSDHVALKRGVATYAGEFPTEDVKVSYRPECRRVASRNPLQDGELELIGRELARAHPDRHLTSKLSGRPTRPNRRRECQNGRAFAPQLTTVHGPLQRKLDILG
jgi:hypothetical protein